MAKEESWYDSQANAAKLITYAALLVLLASIGWAGYSAWEVHQATAGTTTQAAAGGSSPDYHVAMFAVIAGISVAAFLYGVAVVIDLLIVGCEALRNRR